MFNLHQFLFVSLFVLLNFSDPNVGITNITYNKEEFQKLPVWPKFTDSNQRFLEFRELHEAVNGKNLRQKYCDFWDDPEGLALKYPPPSKPLSSWLIICIAVIAVIVCVALLSYIFRRARRFASSERQVLI